MRDTTVAERYAKALFLVTERRGETARALEDLKLLGPLVSPHTRAGEFLASPRVRLADKRQALQRTLEGRCVRVVALFVDLLLRKKRLREIGTVVVKYEALVERKQGIQRAHVTSAVEMTKTEKQRLHRELERLTGAKIRLTEGVEPALIGGAQVRIGDRLIDRSVHTLLDRIAKQLNEVSV